MAGVTPYPTRAKPETLFATACPDADPEGVISRFAAFELSRFRKDQTFAMRGSLTERLRALRWYLCDYARMRDREIPLSGAQIAFLNRPMPLIGATVEISIAAYSLITAEFAKYLEPDDEEALRAGLYWWVTQRSIDLAPGGELVTPAQIRALKAADREDRTRNFPLNVFARRAHAHDPSLRGLNLDLATDRALLVAILMLRCSRHPFLAQVLPEGSVAELLSTSTEAESGASGSLFERLLTLVCDGEASDAAAEARRLHEGLNDRLRQAGHTLAALHRSVRAPPTDIGTCFRPDPRLRPGLERGVAVIGPVHAVSGLGQATRLSVDLLERAGHPPAVIDFSMDNPAPVRAGVEAGARRLQIPRQINLLHLNAELVPLAFAYLDRATYDRSYNVGYVFWELDKVPQCQRLALDMLDEIWVASEYNREIYASVAEIPVYNVGMAMRPLPPFRPTPRTELGLSDEAFVYLAAFDSFSFVERKNPLGVIAAFQAAYPPSSQDDVVLILKTQNRSLVGDAYQHRVWERIEAIAAFDPRIRLIDRTLDYAELLGCTRACDCYVSLHRSEGWGFGLAEAMQMRLPVIATAYSGNMEFCSPETAFLVDFELIAALPDEYLHVERGSRWAEPSVVSAAAAMRAVRGDPASARRRVEEAERRIRSTFGLDPVAKRYGERIDQIRRICERPTQPASRPIVDRPFRLTSVDPAPAGADGLALRRG